MLKGKSVVLKPLEEKNLADTLEWVNNLDIAISINRILPVTSLEHKEWYERLVKDKTQVVFAIERKKDKMHIGNCGLKNIDTRSHKAEMWIYLGEEYTGKKLGDEIVKLLVGYGFDFLNLNRIYLYLLENNLRAKKLYERIGFRIEGKFLQDAFIAGKYHDTIWMGLLRSDYFQRRKD
jgi:RimJ/RimL family protein N-acetyltransferase